MPNESLSGRVFAEDLAVGAPIRKDPMTLAGYWQDEIMHASNGTRLFSGLAVAGVVLVCLISGPSSHAQEVPEIFGKPRIDAAGPLLDWPRDTGFLTPNLEEPSANVLYDLHGQIDNCDIALSTAGNFHMALLDAWREVFLPSFPEDQPLANWFYTTSPPISPEQIEAGLVQFGNFLGKCPVQVAGGPGRLMRRLQDMDVTAGEPVPILSNYGNVLLVKKGNPKNISSIWDLARDDVIVVTSNPSSEIGSFSNYRDSIFRIAANDPSPPNGLTAEMLFNSIFNDTTDTNRWVSGRRIHHREVPWSVAYGEADVGPIFYHLALYATRQFPDLFEIVPLGGTAAAPDPLPGNRVATMNFARIKGAWSDRQTAAVDRLFAAVESEAFTKILARHGLRRPVN